MKMSTKKVTFSAIFLLLFACFLSSQSLVEVAKKEKERRAKRKGKKSIVVTNKTLHKKKIEPALSYKSIKYPHEEILSISDLPEKRSLDNIPSRVSLVKSSSLFADIKVLEDRWIEAKEKVALYTLKMNALQQEYYSMDDMTPRSLIQQQISDTYLKFQNAQKDVNHAKKDLDEAQKKNKKRD
ncbi:MAG: hypothetical protein JSV17_10825 [Candidatus Aminicenantes bacterium]|nr:MAG: hypothetical protein JSV17_10825 [Candidatus Aminicenantes bacterium]